MTPLESARAALRQIQSLAAEGVVVSHFGTRMREILDIARTARRIADAELGLPSQSSPSIPVEPEHIYTSTACRHDLHTECRHTCKFCRAPCRCACHAARRMTPTNVVRETDKSGPRLPFRASPPSSADGMAPPLRDAPLAERPRSTDRAPRLASRP
jgi:hypothetical protein